MKFYRIKEPEPIQAYRIKRVAGADRLITRSSISIVSKQS